MERTSEHQIFPTDPALPTSPSAIEVIARKFPAVASSLASGGLLLSGIPASAESPRDSTHNSKPPSENYLVLDGSWQQQATLPGADLFITTDNVNGEQLPVGCIYFSKTGANPNGSNNAELFKTVPIKPQKTYTLRGLLHYIKVVPTLIPNLPKTRRGLFVNRRSGCTFKKS